jgi:putative flippase GtrA
LSIREVLGRWYPLLGENPAAFVRYVISGVITIAFYALILVSLVEGLDLARGLAVGIGMVLAGLLNYLLNKWFVFRSGRRHVQAAPRYLAVLGGNIAANMAVTWIASDIAGLPYGLVQVVYVLVATVTVFFVLRRWVMIGGSSAAPDNM